MYMGMKPRKHQVEISIFSRQTYQNYEQPCQRHFSTSKIDPIFPNFFL